MSKVTIEVNGYELDLKDDIGFGLNYAIDDIKKPEKRNGNYSKTITLAGSKNNNKFFGALFDVNSDFTFFNPNIKTEARIVIDSSTVLDGFLRLNAIEKESDNMLDGNNIVYKCTVFSKSTDFFTDIKDKKLSELDFSRFTHEYSYDNIVASWSNDYKSVYTYPLLYTGRADNVYKTQYFKPAIFYKAYLKRIAQEAGYTLSGSLMDDSTEEGLAFSKEVIPFSGEIATVPDAEHDRRLFKAGMTASSYSVDSGLVTGDFSIADTDITFINDDSTGTNFDNDNHYNTTLNKYTVDANGNYNLNISLNLEQGFTSKRNIDITQAAASAIFLTFASPHGYTTVPTSLEIQGTTDYDGVYLAVSVSIIDPTTLRINGVTYVSDESGTVGVDRTGDTSYRYNFYVKALKNGLPFYYEALQYLYGYDDLNVVNDWTVSTNNLVTANFPNVTLLDTDELTFEYYVTDTNTTPLNEGVDYNLDVLQTNTNIFNNSNGSAITDGDDIILSDYIPKDANQIDLITDIIKRYNAYFSDNPDKDNEIVIDTRDSYYNGAGVLDWTDKKDFDSKDNITLISELQNKEFYFTYKKSDSHFNETYTNSTNGDVYGVKKIEFNNEFTKGIKKIETPFVSVPLVYNSDNPVAIVPEVSSSVGLGEEIGVLYYGGVIDNLASTWTFEHIESGVITNTTQTQYPYAGHFDNPFTPQLDINFGTNDYLFYNDLENRTNANLYNRFWANYVNQIDNGKLVSSYFNLNEVDIAFIRNNLNTKIFVRDSYYHISKIVDYNPIEKGLTKVELIKIVDGVSFVTDNSVIASDFQKSFRLSSNSDSVDNGNLDLGYNSTIKGYDNGVGADSKNAFITGSNNSIANGIDNAFIIGADNKTITQEGEGWIGKVEYIDGLPVTNTKSYKVYSGLITQTGTSAPSVKVLETDFPFLFSKGYTSTGVFVISSGGTFVADKTFVFIGSNSSTESFVLSNVISTTNINIITKDSSGNLSNGLLTDVPFEIRVYN